MPNMFPTEPMFVFTSTETLGAGSETNCSNSNIPPRTHRRTIYKITSVTVPGIFRTTNAKAIYTFNSTILKNTPMSKAVYKFTSAIFTTILPGNTIHEFNSITAIMIIWDPAVAPV